LDRLAFAGLLEKPLHGFLEGADLQLFVAANHEGTFADQSSQGAREVGDALVLGGLEELPRQKFLTRRAVLGPVNDDASGVAVGGTTDLDAIGTSAVGQRVQALIQVLTPIAKPVEPIEVVRGDFGHIDQLLEQAVVIPARPTFDDRLHLHVLMR
jgi:hypothetical protein